MTRTIAHYRRVEQIGEGTYGQVYRAQCLSTGRAVALKKIRVHHAGYWGMPPTVIREIKILRALRHPSMVELVEVVSSKGVEHLDEDDEREEDRRRRKREAAERERDRAAAKGAAAAAAAAAGGGGRRGTITVRAWERGARAATRPRPRPPRPKTLRRGRRGTSHNIITLQTPY